MKRTGFLLVFMFRLCFYMHSQEADPLSSILYLTGAASVEQLDPDEVERFQRLCSRPVRINQQSEAVMKASGLFSHYQIVSLTDYRSRHGDILSLTELASVDGFSSEYVMKISPFISLESSRLPGAAVSQGREIRHDLTVKGGVKHSETFSHNYAFRYALEAGESLSAGIAVSKAAAADRPDAYSGNISWHFRRSQASVIIGDFNARFGQGLALWNGLSLAGLARPDGMMKRPSFVSASSSFTGNYAFRGFASEALFGKLRVSFLTSLADDGILPGANISWLFRNGQAGITHYADIRNEDASVHIPDMKTSLDFAFVIKGKNIFSETAYDWASASLAALAGSVLPAGENAEIAFMMRYYPSMYNPSHSAALRSATKCSNEYGFSLSGGFRSGPFIKITGQEGFGSERKRMNGNLCLDAAYFPVSKSSDTSSSVQLKGQADFDILLNGSLSLKIRFSERFRTWGLPHRTELRLDMTWNSGTYSATLRTDAVKSDRVGFLSYLEAGLKGKKISACFRQGCFFIDEWDDRIYAYERDIPGSFSVPAYYGRGIWTALTGSWRFIKRGRIYMRAAVMTYPFMKEKKPGKAELKLYLSLDL